MGLLHFASSIKSFPCPTPGLINAFCVLITFKYVFSFIEQCVLYPMKKLLLSIVKVFHLILDQFISH